MQFVSPIEREPRSPYGSYEEKLQLHYAVNDKPEKDEKKDYLCKECGSLFRWTDDQFEASEI